MKIQSHRWVFLLIALAALLGMSLAFYATTAGPGIGGDATIYLTTARGLLEGRGLGWVEADGSYRLLPYTPPFYPITLSGVGLLAKDMVAGARWFNLLLYGGLVLTLGGAFYRATRRTWLAALLAGCVAASPVILGVQVWAMSEPLFLLLGFGGLLLLLEHLERPRWGVLIAAALLCGLAFLTRYIGVAFAAVGGLALLLLGRGADRRLRLNLAWPALREALLFGVIAAAPVLAWMLVDLSVTGTVSSRSGQPASAYFQRLLEMGPALEKIVLFWLVPDSVAARLPGFARAALWIAPLGALAGWIAWVSRRRGGAAGSPVSGGEGVARAARFAWLMGLFIVVYLLALTLVQVLTFPPITLASRMLSPVHAAVLALLFALLHLALERGFSGSRLAVAAVYLIGLGLFGSYALRGALIAREYHQTGIGYMSPVWQNSPTLAAARRLDPNIPIITNETTAIMFFLNRPAYALQEIYAQSSQEAFMVYGAGDDPAQQVFRQKGGALVLFHATLYDDFAMYGDRTEERVRRLTEGLSPYYEGEDGGIYFYARPAFEPDEECD